MKHPKFAKAAQPWLFHRQIPSALPSRSISLHSLLKQGDRGWPEEGQPASKKCGQEQNKSLLCHSPVTFPSKSPDILFCWRGEERNLFQLQISALNQLCFEFI